MPMTASGMKAAIKQELSSKGFNIDHPDTNGEGDRYIDAIATAVVNYIQQSARVVVASGSSSGQWPIV